MSESGRVKVYAFAIYDTGTDEMQRSGRMATREASASVHGAAFEETELEIDASFVGEEIAGMTVRGFGKHSLHPPGFQRQAE